MLGLETCGSKMPLIESPEKRYVKGDERLTRLAPSLVVPLQNPLFLVPSRSMIQKGSKIDGCRVSFVGEGDVKKFSTARIALNRLPSVSSPLIVFATSRWAQANLDVGAETNMSPCHGSNAGHQRTRSQFAQATSDQMHIDSKPLHIRKRLSNRPPLRPDVLAQP